MTSTITLGKAGRLIVPKSMRDLLGLREGTKLKVKTSEGKLELVPEMEETRIEMQDGFPVIRGGKPRQRGDIVRAIQEERESRESRLTSRHRRA